MRRTKLRPIQHQLDQQGQRLLESCLPSNCILRPYRPDYGLDYSLEMFAPSHMAPQAEETLGEHLFIQLKTVRSPKKGSLTIHERFNVEKRLEELDRSAPMGKIQTISKAVEDSELVTIERMGVGQAVLLVIADLSTQECYFVCLNDYIDRILMPRHKDYASRSSRSLHVPIANSLRSDLGRTALRWYGKRAKLFAAFVRLQYQTQQLLELRDDESFMDVAGHFASRILTYDFWDDLEIWPVVGIYADALRTFHETGKPGPVLLDPEEPDGKRPNGEPHPVDEVLRLWELMNLLAGHHEDTCREWFLPTAVGHLTCYSGRSHTGSFSDNLLLPRIAKSAVGNQPSSRKPSRRAR